MYIHIILYLTHKYIYIYTYHITSHHITYIILQYHTISTCSNHQGTGVAPRQAWPSPSTISNSPARSFLGSTYRRHVYPPAQVRYARYFTIYTVIRFFHGFFRVSLGFVVGIYHDIWGWWVIHHDILMAYHNIYSIMIDQCLWALVGMSLDLGYTEGLYTYNIVTVCYSRRC